MQRVPTKRYLLFVALALIGCGADLATKAWAFSLPELREGHVLWLWTGHVGVQLSRNWGALFGIGQGMVWLFASLSILAAIAIPVWLFRFKGAHDLWLTIVLALIMGGVLGNLYDRLGLSADGWKPPGIPHDATYAVRDWILWQVNDRWRWPNFNVADSLLVVGAGLLFFRLLREPQPGQAPDGKSNNDCAPSGPAERTTSEM
jgi:signal peptidase II